MAALTEGRQSELRVQNALNATEIIFAGYKSPRRRARVPLPLEIEDNPLESMVEAGVFLDAEGARASEATDD